MKNKWFKYTPTRIFYRKTCMLDTFLWLANDQKLIFFVRFFANELYRTALKVIWPENLCHRVVKYCYYKRTYICTDNKWNWMFIMFFPPIFLVTKFISFIRRCELTTIFQTQHYVCECKWSSYGSESNYN